MTRLPAILLLAFPLHALTQVGIGTATPHTSAKLEVNASDMGFLPPRVSLTSTTDVSTISTPAAGLLIYNLATAGIGPNDVTPGYYYYNGSAWNRLSTASGLDGLTDAKSGGDNFNNSLLVGSRTTGTLSSATGNTGVGIGVFNSLTTGDINTAVGWDALRSLTTGNSNNALGYHALRNNSIGSFNIAVGSEALKSNTEGSFNTALGSQSLYYNTTGTDNVSVGSRSMLYASTGSANVALGAWALYGNGTGSRNIAVGYNAMGQGSNASNDNVSVGHSSLRATTGSSNTGLGGNTLRANTSGAENTATGFIALYANTTGSSNAAFGRGALYSNTTGSNNTAIGADADVTAVDLTNATAIGYNAKVAASNTIQLGNTSVTSVNTSAAVNAAAFNVTSDTRLKRDVESLDHGLETVLQLQPYRYQKKSSTRSESAARTEYGFIAQDLQALLPELVSQAKDPEGTLSVNYIALIPILARAIQEQQETIDRLNGQIHELDSLLRESASQANRYRQKRGR